MNPGLHGHENVLQIVKNKGWNIYKKYRKVFMVYAGDGYRLFRG